MSRLKMGESSANALTRNPLGLASGTVVVVPYDPLWPELYQAEVARLTPILTAHDISLVIEHTGSTAIPGAAAKPVLDILAGRRPEDSREKIIDALVSADYLYRGEQGIPGRDFFRRGDPRQYHIHLTTIESSFWRDHRKFRDYLRSHPAAVAEYSALKRDLATEHPHDREAYIEGKTAFVKAILERTR